MLLIITVGTGTAGRYSNLAQGLINTIRLSKPRAYWLLPSSNSDSSAVADLIREEMPDLFCPWNNASRYSCILNPDSIVNCRSTVRSVIRHVREQLQPQEALILNATAGTKQMSAGATLAALDEEIPIIQFTIGERIEGVVKTGTERLEEFDAATFLHERALIEARRLYEAGALNGAAKLLQAWAERFEVCRHARDIADCAHAWQRLDFEQARKIAAKSDAPALQRHRSGLTQLAKESHTAIASKACLAELIASADRCASWLDNEDALARLYRAVELGAKLRLASHHHLALPYTREKLERLLPTFARQWSDWSPNEALRLGLQELIRLLVALKDDFGISITQDWRIRRILETRHQTIYGHGLGHISSDDLQAVQDLIRRVMKSNPLPEPLAWPEFPVPAFDVPRAI